jgi:hypothetical protein
MKQSLSLSEQDIKEFKTSILWKATIEGAVGDLLKTKVCLGTL